MPRELWHERSGPRLPTGTKVVARPDGTREATRGRRAVTPECYRCSEDRRKLTAVRIVAGGSTLGTTLLCGECILALTPLDPDPLTVVEGTA